MQLKLHVLRVWQLLKSLQAVRHVMERRDFVLRRRWRKNSHIHVNKFLSQIFKSQIAPPLLHKLITTFIRVFGLIKFLHQITIRPREHEITSFIKKESFFPTFLFSPILNKFPRVVTRVANKGGNKVMMIPEKQGRWRSLHLNG